MMRKCFLFTLSLVACAGHEQHSDVAPLLPIDGLPSIVGKVEYLSSPFVTAGNRVYMIGNQDGSFTDLGWHITGEMGGVWDHPIKLLDGISASLRLEKMDETYCLDSAVQFINYPVGNAHHFNWEHGGIAVDRFQFSPDNIEGLVVQYKLINKTANPKRVTFCVTAKSDLRPTWLADSLHTQDGQDEAHFDPKSSAIVFKDQSNPWYAMMGSARADVQPDKESRCPSSFAADNGIAGTFCLEVSLAPNADAIVPIYVAGSYESEDSAANSLQLLRSNAGKYLVEKITRFQEIGRRSAVSIPDESIAQMYTWLKYNIDWMIREVPSEGIGLSAGLPDYPWWFGADATYSLQGVLATGDHALAKNTIQLLNKISKRTNTNGRIVHEVSTNGVVFNRGNVNETAQFITLVYNYFQWTGDSVLVKELFPDLKKGIDWLMTTKDPDRNGYPNGSGMMEIPGLESDLEMVDVAAYTQQALASASILASFVGEQALGRQYRDRANALAKKIDAQWWVNDQKSYGDFRSTSAEGNDILKAALVRSDTMKKTESVKALTKLQKQRFDYPVKGESTFLIYNNWVVNTPMETGIASPAHALAALQTSRKYQNAYGLFVTGIDKTEEPDSVVLASRKKIFSYTGAVMTLPTGVTAVGAARYGHVDMALESMKKLERSFSYALPGSMYEVSPDFGMMTQAWNIYGVAVPLVTGIFGIQPNAPKKIIRLNPKLPTAWNNAAIDNVRVGQNRISISIKRDGEFLLCEIRQDSPDWIIEVSAAAVSEVVTEDTDTRKHEVADGYKRYRGEKLTVRIDPGKMSVALP